jgi:hypothetical protein
MSSAHPSGSMRLAAALLFIGGAGIAVTTPFILWHIARTGEGPMTPFGFRLLKGGPIDQLGPDVFMAAGVTLTAVSLLDAIAGIWLWRGQRRGATLGLVTSPLAFALGIGFAVPFLLIVAPLRAALILFGPQRPTP